MGNRKMDNETGEGETEYFEKNQVSSKYFERHGVSYRWCLHSSKTAWSE